MLPILAIFLMFFLANPGKQCAGRIKAVRQAASVFEKKDNCGARCTTIEDCDCGICIAGRVSILETFE